MTENLDEFLNSHIITASDQIFNPYSNVGELQNVLDQSISGLEIGNYELQNVLDQSISGLEIGNYGESYICFTSLVDGFNHHVTNISMNNIFSTKKENYVPKLELDPVLFFEISPTEIISSVGYSLLSYIHNLFCIYINKSLISKINLNQFCIFILLSLFSILFGGHRDLPIYS